MTRFCGPGVYPVREHLHTHIHSTVLSLWFVVLHSYVAKRYFLWGHLPYLGVVVFIFWVRSSSFFGWGNLHFFSKIVFIFWVRSYSSFWVILIFWVKSHWAWHSSAPACYLVNWSSERNVQWVAERCLSRPLLFLPLSLLSLLMSCGVIYDLLLNKICSWTVEILTIHATQTDRRTESHVEPCAGFNRKTEILATYFQCSVFTMPG